MPIDFFALPDYNLEKSASLGETMNRKVTIKEIAEHCGISMATVSRAINGNAYVSSELRKKIREYIEDIGWKANSLSDKIQTEMNSDIVVVASLNLLDREESALELKLLLEELYHAGFKPMVRFGHRSESLRKCLKERPVLVVLYGVSDRLYDDIRRLMEAGIRIIGIGEAHQPPCPLVVSDHYAAAHEAAGFLRKNGARRIALFSTMGAQPHPENLERIYSRSAKMIRGICDVFPDFDYTKDAVSDCFGDLTEFKEMLASGRYDGWILGDSKLLNEMIAQEGAFSVMECRIVLLQSYVTQPILPVCLRVFTENVPAKILRLVELIQRPSGGVKENCVPYLGIGSRRKKSEMGEK